METKKEMEKAPKQLEQVKTLLKTLQKINRDEKQKNLQKLYKYASIVYDQQNKNYPKGEVKTIEIEGTYGTHIKIHIIQ